MHEIIEAAKAARLAWQLVRGGGLKATSLFATVPTWQKNKIVNRVLNFDGLVEAGYKGNPLIHACIRELATSVSEVPLMVEEHVGAGQTQEVVNHPLAELMRRPNGYMSGFDLMEWTVTVLHIAGTSYWEKVRSVGGDVVELWPIRPDRMTAVPGGDFLLGYEFRVGESRRFIDINDVVVFKLPHPTNAYYGLSPIAVIAQIGDTDSAAMSWLSQFFENLAVPFGILKLRNRITDKEADRIKEKWRARFQGNFHDVGVLDADASYEKLGLDVKELDLSALTRATETRICMVFGVPPILVGAQAGLERATYSNYPEARKSFWLETLSPMYARLSLGIGIQLLDDFDDNLSLSVAFDMSGVSALQEDITSLWRRAEDSLQAGAITINDFRRLVGLTEIPGADVLLIPLNSAVVPVAGPDALALAQLIQRVDDSETLEETGVELAKTAQLAGWKVLQAQAASRLPPQSPIASVRENGRRPRSLSGHGVLAKKEIVGQHADLVESDSLLTSILENGNSGRP